MKIPLFITTQTSTEKETIKDGVVETFHNNGQLMRKGNYKNGVPDGLWEWFDEYGQVWGRETTKTTRT